MLNFIHGGFRGKENEEKNFKKIHLQNISSEEDLEGLVLFSY